MPKDDNNGNGNRLLSKVAKFVRNPLKDWSELDGEEAPSAEGGYSREMLKEMIERRQRNDFVRKREFDMLRNLRRREASGMREGTPSSSDISSTPGKTEGRALTLKKIDEIEEQMSQQWWRNRPKGEGEPEAGTPDGALRPTGMAAQHARAYADTVPGVNSGQTSTDLAPGPQRAALDGSIEESAIRFAHKDDAGAEAILLQAVAPDNPSGADEEIWRTLFDFYRAIDDPEKFSQASIRYAQRLHRISPSFISLPVVAQQMLPPGSVRALPAGGGFWTCPSRLSREGLVDLTRALSAAGPVWKLDWHALEAIEPDAAGPLRALFVHWADSPVQLRFASSERLLLVLTEATPVNDRSVDAVWWQLHMAALRVVNREDEFELLALNYCITYEVSPPAWEPPKGQFAEADVLPTTMPATGVGVSLSPSVVASESLPPVRLAGELQGESLATWQRLEADLAKHPMAPISCAGLLRLDFAAAGTLLNWVMARDASGQRVRFVDAHRLVAAFFAVIGITNHADIAVRMD